MNSTLEYGDRDPSPNRRAIDNFDFETEPTRAFRLIYYIVEGALFGFTFFVGWIIWSMVIWKKSTTPGHALLGQRVVDYKTGAPVSWGRMFFREFIVKVLIVIFSAFSYGLVSAVDCILIFRPDKRTLHDHICGTKVVNDASIALLAK